MKTMSALAASLAALIAFAAPAGAQPETKDQQRVETSAARTSITPRPPQSFPPWERPQINTSRERYAQAVPEPVNDFETLAIAIY